MFLYGSKLPENPTFAPNLRSEQEQEERVSTQVGDLYRATRDLQLYRDNSNAEELATTEAYERRNKQIFDATGVQLTNPFLAPAAQSLLPGGLGEIGGGWGPKTRDYRGEAVADWEKRVADLQRERPELADRIGADRPIRQDALDVTRSAERNAEQLRTDDLGFGQRLATSLGGGVTGMVRDPLQVATLIAGGGWNAGRTVAARVFGTMLTEAAINAGVEGAVQAASQSWRKEAGVEHGLTPALKQVGIAGLFGAGFGGLMQGGAEVFRALGKAAPEEALQRFASGQAQPSDLDTIAAALGRPLDPETSRVAQLAIEQDELDRVAFGPAPDDIEPARAERLAADALRDAENPREAPMSAEMQERFEQIDRILRNEAPLGKRPRQPESLIRFLARDGIKDEAGAMSAMGLRKRFIPGRGRLVRESGLSLDYARERAAEAGYFNDLYGSAEEAVARSTPDDLLRAIDEEVAGTPRYSIQEDGERMAEVEAFQSREENQLRYRRVLEDIDAARVEMELGAVHDRIMSRAARLVDDEVDAYDALERAFEEDYRAFIDAPDLAERAPADDPDFEIPFFPEETGTRRQARGDAGALGADDGRRHEGTDAGTGEQLQDPRSVEAQAGSAGLRASGATPEPGTPQAGDLADLALVEARRPNSESTPAGEQTLIDGVAPVSTRERLEAEGAKPMRGGESALPDGGLFDDTARNQLDIWDAIPAARTADGEVAHITHASMLDDAERSDFFGDLIASCKD
ncbi:hypothetical protein JYU29_04950 [Tianweitania sp. BSSL-BM11]|uniref:Large polyvalent protein associated domain-containing protein n=1 Tax=Tianweitania aestuarii TaxID=2814886 RepID=A0ABS5RT98_9HYPH|nr:hypothetical protein [Tianweitania aestuarii]MBS9720035.1 hypothetical protein [Tianweitania aestuarii]